MRRPLLIFLMRIWCKKSLDIKFMLKMQNSMCQVNVIAEQSNLLAPILQRKSLYMPRTIKMGKAASSWNWNLRRTRLNRTLAHQSSLLPPHVALYSWQNCRGWLLFILHGTILWSSSETQGLVAGMMQYFWATDIFSVKVHFKNWRAPRNLGCFRLCQTDQAEISGNTWGK